MTRALKLNLPPPDDLFTTQAERDEQMLEKLVEIPLSEITSFPNHPFQVKDDAEMQEMAESVGQYGVLVPALVRPKPQGGYEMIAGHRRGRASEIAGLETLPCIVRNLNDDQAIIVMVDSNLQREKILPSEKAFAYKMKLDAMRRQGQRTDITSSPVGMKLQGKQTLEMIGNDAGDSRNQVHRYIRLTNLIPQVLDLVDEGEIAMRPAVELSYLAPEQQQVLVEAMASEESTPSHVQAAKMRKFAAEEKLNAAVILSIMQEQKPNQVEQFKMPKARISQYFAPGTPAQKIEDTIVKALELWRKREQNRDSR